MSKQRSFTVYGDEDVVQVRRRELVAQFGVDRSALYCDPAGMERRGAVRPVPGGRARVGVGDALVAHLDGALAGSRADRCDRRRGVDTAACRCPHRCPAAGGSVGGARVWARWAVLHSCLSWATRQRLLRSNPLATMKAPPRPAPRKHLGMDEIALLLRAADAEVVRAADRISASPGRRTGWQQLFVAEQNRLLIRLAADTGARRRELAALRLSDLDG